MLGSTIFYIYFLNLFFFLDRFYIMGVVPFEVKGTGFMHTKVVVDCSHNVYFKDFLRAFI